MSFSNEVLEQDAKENAQRLDARNRAAWEEICNTTDVSEGESFYQRVLTFCEGEITSDKFAMLQATCPAGYDLTNRVHGLLIWWQGTKENLIAQIVEKKRRQLAPTGVLDPRDVVELRNFASGLLNLSKAELRAKRDEQEFKQEVRNATEARQYLSKFRKLEDQKWYFTKSGQRFPKLPLHVVPPGFVTAIPRDARYYHTDVVALKKDLARFGEEQVNKRIAATQDSLRGE